MPLVKKLDQIRSLLEMLKNAWDVLGTIYGHFKFGCDESDLKRQHTGWENFLMALVAVAIRARENYVSSDIIG